MNTLVKSLAVVSAVFLLAACETAPGANGGASGTGSDANGLSSNANRYPDGGTLPGTDISDRVFFDLDSSVINAEGQQTLQQQAAWLKENASVKVTIEGHADERGTREYNLALGERRAVATKKYLSGLGVPSGRISTISYGKERPAVTGSDDASYAENRRAVTAVR